MTYAYPYPPPTPPPARARGRATAVLAAFFGALIGLVVLAAIVVVATQPPPPEAPCPPDQPCAPPPSLPPVADGSPTPLPPTSPGPIATPPAVSPVPVSPAPTPASDSPPVLAGELWRSEALGYSFEYDPDVFELDQSSDDLAVFGARIFDAQVVVRAAPAETSPAELIEQLLASVDRFVIGRVPDTDDYDALLGPSIGYVRGEGGVYSGTILGADGTPVAPAGITVLASSDGRLTVGVVVLVGQPDVRLGSETHQHVVRNAADEFLKTFDWDAT